MEDRFPDVSCPRCSLPAQLYTVPLRLIPTWAPAWQALCGSCFRDELQVEPSDELRMRPIRHARGRR